jgi:hypothetical protein
LKTAQFYILVIISLPLLLLSQENSTRYFERINVGYGPEDFVLDTFNYRERLIISCASRRSTDNHFKELVGLNIANDSTYILPRLNEPKDFDFNPHGLDIQEVDKTLKLYVVNHPENGQDQILIYHVFENHLELETIVESDLFISLNSVAAHKNGSFYVTNDSGKKGAIFEKLFALRNANVVYHDLQNNSSKISLNNLAYANGLAIKDNVLFVSTTQRNDLFKLNIAENGSLTIEMNYTGVKGMNNITIHENYLLIPAHPKFFKFIKHLKDAKNFSPGEVYLYDYEKNKRPKLFYNDGSIISAPATALFYKNYLYIGQVFDDFLVKIPLNLD